MRETKCGIPVRKAWTDSELRLIVGHAPLAEPVPIHREGCNGNCDQGRQCDCVPDLYADEHESDDFAVIRGVVFAFEVLIGMALLSAAVGYLFQLFY